MKRLYTSGFAILCISLVSLAQSPRTVLLETSTSNWLKGSAHIICTKEAMKSAYGDDLVVLSYHPDNVINGGDPFYTDASNNWTSELGISQLSRGVIDRVSYNGTTLTSLVTDVWSDTIAARINRPTGGLVTLPEVLYDPTTREIFVRIQFNVTEDNIELADYRFFLYVAEDNRLAEQLVDTNAGFCSILPDTNDTTYDFNHMDIVLANPSSVTGTDNIIPSELTAGGQFTWSYTYKVHASKNINNLKVVGFVAAWEGEDDITSNYVINAAGSGEFTEYDSSDEDDPNHPDNPDNPNSAANPNNWPNAVGETVKLEDASFFPNPMHDLGVLEFSVPKTQNVRVTLCDINGRVVKEIYDQKLASGRQRAAVSANGLDAGIYLIQVQGADFTLAERIAIH